MQLGLLIRSVKVLSVLDTILDLHNAITIKFKLRVGKLQKIWGLNPRFGRSEKIRSFSFHFQILPKNWVPLILIIFNVLFCYLEIKKNILKMFVFIDI